jgi:SpoVK/Ycf46/Vps4 family AAA+-type ATPase
VEMKNIAQLLQSFRSDLPDGSKTAAAIDRNASLEEISELAEGEGLHKLASVLFEAEQEALRSGSATLEDAEVATDTFIREARQDLPAGSKTAAAIDRGASWEEISELAEEEGLHQIASVLFEAEQERLRSPS